MNFNTSPIAFFPSRAAQIWRAWFAQRKISVICGADLLPFYIIDNGSAPAGGELYDPNTDTKIADVDFAGHLLDHDITVDGQSRHVWIYQGEMAGVFGNTNPGYYYLKIGNWYSDVFKIGALSSEYTEISWQFYDDIITADGTPISKHIKYKQIFETPLWHPTYNVEEEGKTNNGIFFAMSQTTKKTSGFNAIVNESQLDCLNLTRMADMINIKACLNGTTRTMQTNQFEISSKWESDDVASIECQFDLFAIIRKYQQSNVEPEPLPIPVPPTPPGNYYIRGTVETGTSNIKLNINGTVRTISCTNGAFELSFDEPVTILRTSTAGVSSDTGLQNVDKIKTLDISDCGDMTSATDVALNEMPLCTSINLGNSTFENVTSISKMFMNNAKLATINAPEATFASSTGGLRMFMNCGSLTSINLPKAEMVAGAYSLFENCENLTTINMPLSTFASETGCVRMFYNCKKLTSVDFSSATFANVDNFYLAFSKAGGFYDSGECQNVFIFSDVFPACIAQPGSIEGMFKGSNFQEVDITAMDLSQCTNASELFADGGCYIFDMNASQFSAFVDVSGMFKNCDLYSGSVTTLASVTFSNVTNAENMFSGMGVSGTDRLDLTAATFENATNIKHMFDSSSLKIISMPVATFASAKNGMYMFYNCASLSILTMSAAVFGSVVVSGIENPAEAMFNNCAKLQYLTLPSVGGMWKHSVSFAQSKKLTADSLVGISQWITNVVTSQRLTIHNDAYNTIYSDGVKWTTFNGNLTTKNWTLSH